MAQKHTLKEIKIIADEYNLTVLSSEYIPKEKLAFKCQNNHIYESSLQNMTKRKGCPECRRLSKFHEFVNLANSEGYQVLTREDAYINTRIKLDVKCPEGHCVSIDINHFNSGKRCRFCKVEKLSKDRRLTRDELINRYASKGYVIIDGLDDYRNEKDFLTVQCPNGHIYTGAVNVFNHGHECMECFSNVRGELLKGENHPNWKGGITPLKNIFRDSIGQWKKESMYESNYKCVMTGDNFSHIHHLYSFNKIVEGFVSENNIEVDSALNDYSEFELKRIIDSFVEYHNSFGLGVCLREDVHKLYHKIYGDNNTPLQFDEFKRNYNRLKEAYSPSTLDAIYYI